jgi:hypothetical protein
VVKYYKIKSDKVHYKGDKYFRFDPLEDHVIQVCVEKDSNLKGKVHAKGVYEISRTTFLTNYYQFYIEISNRKVFEDNFFKAVKSLIK